MTDARTDFDGAVTTFRNFLRSQGWSDRLLWLSREHVTGHRCKYWILKPDELDSDVASRRFYESTRRGSGSIRIDALSEIEGKTVCYVENYGGDSRMLNFGIWTGHHEVKVVRSAFRWTMLHVLNRLRGENPFLRHVQMTNRAEPGTTPNPHSPSAQGAGECNRWRR